MNRNSEKKENIRQIINSLSQILNALNSFSKELMKTFSITGPQLGALRKIAQVQQISLSELSQKMYLHISTVSGIADRLEAAGHIIRRRSTEDRRVVYLSVTDKGKEMIDRAPHSGFGKMVHGLDEIPVEKVQQIHDAIRLLVKMMEIKNNVQ